MSYNAFLNNFDSQRCVENEYRLEEGTLDGCMFIVADYTYENYSGSSFVLYVGNDGKLYENHGSHCSCYGLEGQWSPEETTVEELEGRLDRGGLSEYEYVIREGLKYLKKGRGMKKVVYFEASDGERFEDEDECRLYEIACELKAGMLICGLNGHQAEIAANYIIENLDFTFKS